MVRQATIKLWIYTNELQQAELPVEKKAGNLGVRFKIFSPHELFPSGKSYSNIVYGLADLSVASTF